MFGYVTVNIKELTKPQRKRYNAVYCGICRQIHLRCSSLSRLGLSYDMAFLALLLMSLYEPEETSGTRACGFHPIHPKPWVDNEYIRYAADMNVALAYYKAQDDWNDDKNPTAKMLAGIFGKSREQICREYPRQWDAIVNCIQQLSLLEKEGCANPDMPASCFGALMGELLVYREDLWAPTLRKMGMALGRFIYLADAARDYRTDKRKGKYNPFLAMGTGETPDRWEEYLILDMANCTREFEKLPLVQDKEILDNVLYSGIWLHMRRKKEQEESK